MLILLLPIDSLFAQAVEGRLYKNAASMGMGGVGVSTIGYTFSVIRNPANLGLMADHDLAPFVCIGASLNPDMFSLLDEVKKVTSGQSSFGDINYDQFTTSLPNVGLNGPLGAGYMGKGFGFWTTSSSDVAFAVRQNPENIIAKSGVSLNTIAKTADEYFQAVNTGPVSTSQLRGIVERNIGKNLSDLGISEKDIINAVDYIVSQLETNPDAFLHTFIPEAVVAATVELTANLGYGYRIPFAALDDVSGLSLGVTVRYSQRFKMTSDGFIDISQMANIFSSLQKNIFQAGSISSDFGMSLRIQNWIFGIAVRDALSTGYVWKSIDGLGSVIQNSKIPFSVDFGTSYRFYFNNHFIQEVGLYLEFENASNPYISWANKVRAGVETKLFRFLDVRVGIYDSFITAGLGAGWKWGRIDFAYYRQSYLEFFKSDQFYLNFTVGLDNSPQRKARARERFERKERAKTQAGQLVDNSLKGV
ncbi:MAG: hypothetical protein ACRCTQ_01465 [Brevinemataceae bacterium]